MGKGDKIILTKDGLKSENLKLSLKLKSLQSDYKDIHNIFVQLGRDYENSKGTFPVQRYSQLKRMIKAAVTDQNLRKAESFIKKEEGHKHKGGLSGLVAKAKEFSYKDDGATTGSTSGAERGNMAANMGGLLSACKNFAGKSDGLQESAVKSKDLSKMSKQEVAEDNELKKRQIEEFDTKFLRAYNRLDKLKRDYETSKQLFVLARYGEMKNMIKTVTEDKTL